MALALRQADRGLAHDYPNCHFPEIYILQGGYCRFFREYAQLCEPQQYICMDDPRFLARRSSELNGFRKQFSRHRSFTYGEGRRQVSQSYQGRQTIKEEDAASLMDESPCPGTAKILPSKASLSSVVGRETNEQAAGDTSFGSVGDSSFEDGIGDSPCAAAGSRKPVTMLLQPRVGSLGRRPLLRAGTTGNILPRF
jgi:M-phase inducer tyrosine phosphatase